MCIAYALNWLYFDVDNSNLESHAIRRHIISSMVYGLCHLPFIMVCLNYGYFVNEEGITLVGAALEYLVIASDCSDANPEWLTDEFQGHSDSEISDGLRWFFCGGLAVALACMSMSRPFTTNSRCDLIISRPYKVLKTQSPQTISLSY